MQIFGLLIDINIPSIPTYYSLLYHFDFIKIFQDELYTTL